MTIDPTTFQERVRTLLIAAGTLVSDVEMTTMATRYPRCRGTDAWEVRAYAGRAANGAREYRVVRGTGVDDVFASPNQASAAAVQTALNALENDS